MNNAADTGDVVVRPSTIIRRIIGSRRLSGFVERRDGPGLGFAAVHAALLIATGWMLWRVLGTVWAAPATIVHGIVIVHLFAPFHESTHYTAFRTRWLNTAAGWITGLVLMLPPTVFTIAPLRLLAWNMAYHTAHHALPQAPFFRLAALDAVLRDHVAETRAGYVDFVRTHLDATTWFRPPGLP